MCLHTKWTSCTAPYLHHPPSVCGLGASLTGEHFFRTAGEAWADYLDVWKWGFIIKMTILGCIYHEIVYHTVPIYSDKAILKMSEFCFLESFHGAMATWTLRRSKSWVTQSRPKRFNRVAVVFMGCLARRRLQDKRNSEFVWGGDLGQSSWNIDIDG